MFSALNGSRLTLDPHSGMTVKTVGGVRKGLASMGGSMVQVGVASSDRRYSIDYRDYSTAGGVSSRLPLLDNCVIPGHALEIGQR